jgi:hypothetical protein
MRNGMQKTSEMSSAISHQIQTPDFDTIRAMEPEQASKPIMDILRTMEAADDHIESLTRQTFALRGAAMKIAQDMHIYKFFIDEEVGKPFRSLDRFNKVMFPKSWRYNQEALATITKLPDVPIEQLVSIPRCNMLTLTHTSTNVRALPEVIEAAQTLSEDEFAGKLTKEHGQHLERLVTLKFIYPQGDAETVKQALRMVGELIDVEDMPGQLLALAIDYIQEHQ